MKRNTTIDILKGISILLVVLGHTRFFGTNYIYLFHMAVFFMASGYFYKDTYSDSLKNVWSALLRRIKSLYIPFVVWNTVYTLLNNVFIRLNIYTSDEIVRSYLDKSLASTHSKMSVSEMAKNIIKGLFLAGHTELGGAFWFLRVLFYISVSYLFVDYIIKRIVKKQKFQIICQGVVSILFLAVGFYMSLKGIETFALDRLFSCYCLYFIGKLLSTVIPKKWEKTSICVLTAIVCFFALYGMSFIGTISLGSNKYINPVFMLAASLLGWFMLYSISIIFNKLALLKSVFCLLGQNSIIIVIFHFLCFKPVNLLVALVNDWPSQTVSGFPVSVNTGLWWILYAVVSISLCLLISLIWNYIKKCFCKIKLH